MAWHNDIGSSGTGACTAKSVAIGALTANVDKTLTHNLNKANVSFTITNGINNVMLNKTYPDPADPTNKIIVQSVVNVAAGLTLNVIGWN